MELERCFNILTVINSIKTVFIHGQSAIGTYYHPDLKIMPLFGQFQEQTTRLLLRSWYLHRLVAMPIWLKRVFIRDSVVAVCYGLTVG